MKRNITFKQLLVFMSVFFLATPLIQAQENSAIREYLQYYDSIQYFRFYDQRGINVFETTKEAPTYQGFRVRFGAGFTQQYQAIKHENKGATNFQTTNRLYPPAGWFHDCPGELEYGRSAG